MARDETIFRRDRAGVWHVAKKPSTGAVYIRLGQLPPFIMDPVEFEQFVKGAKEVLYEGSDNGVA